MRNVLLASAILVGIGSRAFAADVEYQADNNPPIRFHHVTPIFVIRQGSMMIPIQSGLTPLDKGFSSVNCVSATGCIVTARVTVSMTNTEYPTVSAYVDGIAMTPPSYLTGLGASTLIAQQSTTVAAGAHKLQSQLDQQTEEGDIVGWEVEYTVFPLK